MVGHLDVLGLRLRQCRGGTRCSVYLELRVILLVEIDYVLDIGDDLALRAASFIGRGGVGTCRGGFVDFLAVRAVLDDETDGLFNADPVELLGDGGGRFVDPAMLLHMHDPRNFILPLRVGHHLLVLEHQPLSSLSSVFPTRRRQQLVVGGGAAEAAFLGAVGAGRVFAVFEVEADFVEALFGDKVFAVRAQVAAIDDGVDEVVGVGAQSPAAFDAADAFEA